MSEPTQTFSLEELVDVAETKAPAIPTVFAINGRPVSMLVDAGIVTEDFLLNLDRLTREERRARAQSAAQKALTEGNRQERRAAQSSRGRRAAQAEGVDVEAAAQPPTGDEETTLAPRARNLRFMAETCGRVILDWNLAEKVGGVLTKIEPTADFFRTWEFDRLQPLFEHVCFEAATPGKK